MKISVILPVRNSSETVIDALDSIARQTHQDIEIIAIDGASSDNTVNLLKAWTKRPLRWVSEPDSGTAEAMNKGLAMAQGELITFLFADDYFSEDHAFGAISHRFAETPTLEAVFSGIRVTDPRQLVETRTFKPDPTRLFWSMSVYLPGAFFRKSSLQPASFDENFKISNDYLFACELLFDRQICWQLNETEILTMRLGGLSSDPRFALRCAVENFKIRRRFFGLWRSLMITTVSIPTSILRALNVRPYTWVRKVRRALSPRPKNA